MRRGLHNLHLNEITGLDRPLGPCPAGDQVHHPMMGVSTAELARSMSTGALHENLGGLPDSAPVVVHREAPLKPLQRIKATAPFRSVEAPGHVCGRGSRPR